MGRFRKSGNGDGVQLQVPRLLRRNVVSQYMPHIRMLEDSLDKLLEPPKTSEAEPHPSRRVGATRRRSTTTAATVTGGAPNPLLNSA